jgi:hypothetical protein
MIYYIYKKEEEGILDLYRISTQFVYFSPHAKKQRKKHSKSLLFMYGDN